MRILTVVGSFDGYLRYQAYSSRFHLRLPEELVLQGKWRIVRSVHRDFDLCDQSEYKIVFCLARYRRYRFCELQLWSEEREERINTQDELEYQTVKWGRPEITLGLKNDVENGQLWVCLMNYSDRAAVNVRIDDIPCGDHTLGFINPPNQLTSGVSPNIQVYYVGERGESELDIATTCILNLKKHTHTYESLQLAIRYTDIDGHEWTTFGTFRLNVATRAFDLAKQWVEKGELKPKPVLTF